MTSQKPKFLKIMFHLKKKKRQFVAAIVWISVLFHSELIIARIVAGKKKSPPPLSLVQHLQ